MPSDPDTTRPTISVCVITLDEERRIRDCLESVRWADELVVVDSGSTDRTCAIAESLGARVIRHEWAGFVGQKNVAMDACASEWVLSLDADETVTEALRDEIRSIVTTADGPAGYDMPRHVWYLGRWINHGGWYPDRKVRLVRRGHGRWEGRALHERLVVDGAVGSLRSDLVHVTYEDFAHQLRTLNRFSDLAAEDLARRRGVAGLVIGSILRPPIKFLECYLWKLGVLDGFPGLVIAVASGASVFARYVKAWERRRGHSTTPPRR